MGSNLVLHKGGKLVSREELDAVLVPDPTDTWFPIAHNEVLESVVGKLNDIGFEVKRQQLALSNQGARFFGTLDLVAPIAEGVTLAVGVRNSIDKSFPMGLVAGSRVFLCDNLAFASSIKIQHKHTRFGAARFESRLTHAVAGLQEYREVAAKRIEVFQHSELSEDKANSIMLQAFENKVISTRLLPKVIEEYREPSHEEFKPRTVWSLLNAFTEVLKERRDQNPHDFARLTIRLESMLAALAA